MEKGATTSLRRNETRFHVIKVIKTKKRKTKAKKYLRNFLLA